MDNSGNGAFPLANKNPAVPGSMVLENVIQQTELLNRLLFGAPPANVAHVPMPPIHRAANQLINPILTQGPQANPLPNWRSRFLIAPGMPLNVPTSLIAGAPSQFVPSSSSAFQSLPPLFNPRMNTPRLQAPPAMRKSEKKKQLKKKLVDLAPMDLTSKSLVHIMATMQEGNTASADIPAAVPTRADPVQFKFDPSRIKEEIVFHDDVTSDDIQIIDKGEVDKQVPPVPSVCGTDAPYFMVTRKCALHPLYQCYSPECSMQNLTLGNVCQILGINCPQWAKLKHVSSAGAIACCLATLEDKKLRNNEYMMCEELKKTFRFCSMSYLAKAFKIVGERLAPGHFEDNFQLEGGTFFNIPMSDVENALALSIGDWSAIPAAEEDLILFPSRRMAAFSYLKPTCAIAVGYDTFATAVHSAVAYAPPNIRYLVLILPENFEWLNIFVQLQALEQIAMEKECIVVLLCPPIYGPYPSWKERMIAFQKAVADARKRWERKHGKSRVGILGTQERATDTLNRYFACLGIHLDRFLENNGQLRPAMITHYLRGASFELQTYNFKTSFEFIDNHGPPRVVYPPTKPIVAKRKLGTTGLIAEKIPINAKKTKKESLKSGATAIGPCSSKSGKPSPSE